MTSDRIYSPGGASTTDGNYPRTNTPKSQVLRLLYLQRGSMSARPDLGTDWESVSKIDDEAGRKIQRVIEEGQAPLVESGAIRDLTVDVTLVTDYGVGYLLTWVDATTGDSVEHEGERAWTR